ncbi:MAG: PQQ-dependent sugar dehydrogenase [Sediminicola sp.]
MKNRFFIVCIMAVLLNMMACSDDDKKNVVPDPDPDPENPSTGMPVETNDPNTDYEPAFEGQTRVDGVTTTTPYVSTIVTSSLTAPWGITSLPDGRLLVTEKAGNLRIVTASGTVGDAITGLPGVNDAGQGGLLGICIDPDFADNRMVYWVFSENVAGGTVTSVAKGQLAENESGIEDPTIIYRADPSANGGNHYGGRILFDETGNLLVSTGDRSGNDTRPLAQSVTAALGKIVRITVDGSPAPGNPSFSEGGALPELYSMGHRNPQGLALHPVTGEVWQSEHGPRGGDEINRVLPGENYGWPTITYGIEYGGEPVGAGIQEQEGLEQPVYYWDPVISPSGITFYAGDRIPEWENNLFVGALSGTHIARLVIEDNRVTGEERLLASEGERFRDLTQGTDNALYAITDAGRLYRIDRE